MRKARRDSGKTGNGQSNRGRDFLPLTMAVKEPVGTPVLVNGRQAFQMPHLKLSILALIMRCPLLGQTYHGKRVDEFDPDHLTGVGVPLVRAEDRLFSMPNIQLPCEARAVAQ